jgi:hypothetical protein
MALEEYQISGERHYFEKSPENWVEIKAAGFTADSRRQKFLNENSRVIHHPNGSREFVDNFTTAELQTLELFLSFGGSNITHEDAPLFDEKCSKSLKLFTGALGHMPPPAILEWWRRVREVNPHWAPAWASVEEDEEGNSDAE